MRPRQGHLVQAEPLLALAAIVAGEQNTRDVLEAVVRGLSEQPGVALARIWLLRPGDICEQCFMRPECSDQTLCLQLVASAGKPMNSPGEDWAVVQGQWSRIPTANKLEGRIATEGNSVLIGALAEEGAGIIRPGWARSENLRSFAGHPLVFRGKILGVLALFSREPLDEQDSVWLRMFADQAAVAITNAMAFEAREQAEAALREHLRLLQQVLDIVPQHMYVFTPDASSVFKNRAAVEYFPGGDPFPPREFFQEFTHPEDLPKVLQEFDRAGQTGATCEVEARMRGSTGQYRWFLQQLFPLRDEEGRIVRWCGTQVDIEDRKQAEDRTQRENLALRDEVDKASMFEEIVGSSAALQSVLARVARVAPTDSTVLITGETGTGKELVARAIHKRSQRSARAFVSVNCAAIPRDLIASELFGHEKGAFTGALQRRLGRFELAEGGTIFLDEIGELTQETQVALLRVLQEREFDRVGGSRPIRADVRVIAATHRDLPAAIAAGTFRSDLFYRINVFPVDVPPLRERKEDIRLLVEYFIDRYSSKAGKKIRRIDKKSLEGLQSYPWPGNIRELQNIIERSVIVCDTENFSVDESWLSQERRASRPLSDELVTQEKELIEAALARTHGRVSGPAGAAAELGMPASTLDSKIKSLKIDKRRFQTD
jgi:PAS domain S-box-containing protein